jgi:predicted ATPase
MPEAGLPRYEPWTEAVRWERLMLEKIRGFGGVLLQHTSSLLLCVFGLPRTLEHLPQRAVQAALALRQMVTTPEDLSGTMPRPHVRLAVHVGKVLVDVQAPDAAAHLQAMGETLALPVRLLGQAEPGEVVVSPAVKWSVDGWVTLEARVGRRAGVSEQIEGYAVISANLERTALALRRGRALGQLVGRERELGLLDTALQQVERGQGQVVGLMGDAGVGKSRLLFEFRQRVAKQRVTYVEGRCLSYGSTMPYLPVLDLLRVLCGITPADAAETISTKVRHTLQRLGLVADAGLPYLLQLLGVSAGTEALEMLTPEAIKTRTFALLHQICLSSSQQRPLILEVEDLHWIDSASEAYFAALAEALPGAPICLLVTYRPGYRPPWMDKSHATQLTLGPLSTQESLALMQAAQQQTPLSDALARLILDKAEGNPFFLEELTKAVLEQSTLPATVTVPTTIQGVLLARMDRLPEVPKRLLQTAAVLGRAFVPRLLAAIWDGPDTLDSWLQELQRLEFLYERHAAQESLYVFKHALIQEVAYESLVVARRQALHAAAGEALETLYAGRLEEAYERLAYHYARTTDSTRAVAYLTHVARKAARGYALVEAVTALQEARRHVTQLPDAQRDHLALTLVLRQARLLTFLGRLPQTLELLLEVQEELDRLQEPALEGPYYALLSTTYSLIGDRQHATQHALRALTPATQCGDQATLGRTYYVLSMENMWSGQWSQGVMHGQQAIASLEQAQDQGWLGQAYWITGANYMFAGEFAQALAAEAQVQVIGEAIGSPRLQSYAAWTTGLTRTLMGVWEDGIRQCQRAVEQAPDPFCTAEAQGFLGYAYLEKGDAAAALPILGQAAQRMQRIRFRQLESWFTIWWGEACLLDGQYARAQELARQGLEIARDVSFQVVVGWGQRVLGQVALARRTYAEAMAHLQAALATFTAIASSTESARTLLALAALAHAQGHREAATAHLYEAYARFQTLQLPVHMDRTRQLATACGLAIDTEPAA